MADLKRLSESTLQTIGETAEIVLAKILQGKNGGGVARISYAVDENKGVQGWQQVFVGIHGNAEEDAYGRRRIVSSHKASTLMVAHALDSNVVSSWQFRDHKIWAYGGAVIVTANIPELGGDVKLLISFSGLTEEEDEMFGLLLATTMGWGSGVQNTNIIAQSGNTLALRFLM